MSVGKLGEFDVGGAAWSAYEDRLEMYFKVNKVEDDMKLPTLIAIMGDEAYELLVNLACPQKPSALTYTQACGMLRQHLQPSPSIWAERFRFRQRRQSLGENIAAYVAALKKAARFCKFEANLNSNLRDQFVCGLRSDVIRQRLFAEDEDLTFTNAVKLASSLEAAEINAAAVEPAASGDGSVAASLSNVHALQLDGRERPAGAGWGGGGGRAGGGGAGSSAGRPGTAGSSAGGGGAGARDPRTRGMGARGRGTTTYHPCRACGAQGHSSDCCRFRDYVCSRCKLVGHLRRVCPKAGRPGGGGGGHAVNNRLHYAEERGDSVDGGDADLDEELHNLCLGNYRAVSVPLSLDNKIVHMEVDTGTAISCISKQLYDKYFREKPIEENNVSLKLIDGTKIQPLGIIKPEVKYRDKVKQLELFVIEGGTTSLLGRQWLAELGIIIPSFNCNNVNSDSGLLNKQIDVLTDRYKALFDGGLGRYTGGKATLRVREGARPVFHRARPVPFALRDRIDAELDAMLRAGVIEPVDCSDWASPLVPVNKADGALRICADYKSTLNPVLLVDRYPLPRFDEVLVGLNGAQYFSKIDLSQAYNQIELDDSKEYTVVNTHRGLFKYNRLVYGLSSSSGIFQRIMCNLLGGIPNVEVFLDDVIIGGRTEAEHLQALETVFMRLQGKGLKLKKSKCVFLVDEVTYLGFIISKDGVKTDPSKIEAILKITRPSNVPELRSFLGMVNFYAKFVRNLSSLLVPLYNLLKKGFAWQWNSDCESAFKGVKKLLTSSPVLAHYDPTAQLFVTCDASAQGVGGVLSQRGAGGEERPVAYASRTLSDAEKNYSQIHREALAIIFCLKKFHQYVYGRHFTLRTDHKPLVTIFGSNAGIPVMAASRMQRWAIILSAYDYDIEYVRTYDNGADALSRLPLANMGDSSGSLEQTFLHIAQEALLLDYNHIRLHTGRDPILGRVLHYIRNGWPADCDVSGLQPYFNRRNELYEELGCVMWGHRLVVPESCWAKVLEILHEPHMGIVKSKAMARSYVWWAGLDEAVEATCRACAVCAAQADAPPRAQHTPWLWPARPWTRLHLDFMGPILGKTYLVVVDSTSKWIEVFPVPSTAAVWTIDKLIELWSRWGVPKQIVSDNGPPFTSGDFSTFLKGYGVDHVFTAPYHPSSNGAAENAVKTLKRVIRKASYDKQSVEKALHTFLLHYRNTEHATTGASPSMLLQGRRLRTRLDALKPDVESRVCQVQQRQVEDAGGVSRAVNPGDEVWYRQYLRGDKWLPGRVVRSLGPKNFEISTNEGTQLHHRHVDQLRRRSRSSLVCPAKDTQEGSGSSSFVSRSPVAVTAEAGLTVRPSTGGAGSEECSRPSVSPARSPGGPQRQDSTLSPVQPDAMESTEPSPIGAPAQPTNRPKRACNMNKCPRYKF